jgi:hypothetical protein
LSFGQIEASFCGEGVPSDVDGADGGAQSYANDDGTLSFSETLYGWASDAQAEEAYDLLQRDIACGTGTIDNGGSDVTFDVSEQDLATTYGDESAAYAGTATNGGQTQNVIFVAVRKGQYLLTFGFAAPEGTTDAPDVRELVRAATEKLGSAAA